MDNRSWPWKKKSSDKQEIEKTLAAALASSTAVSDVAFQMAKVFDIFLYLCRDQEDKDFQSYHLSNLTMPCIYIIVYYRLSRAIIKNRNMFKYQWNHIYI